MRLGLGLTFQTNRAFHSLSVRQNLEAATPGRARHLDQAAELSATATPSTGSGSIRRAPCRPASCRIISCNGSRSPWCWPSGPTILLLDEPTAGMSPDETMQTARVLQHLNRSGLTIVVVEHDVAFVREVAQRVTVLHQGRVFAEGTVDEITADQEVRRIYLGRA